MRKKLLAQAISVVLLVLIAVGLYGNWNAVLLWAAPKAVLSAAVEENCTQLWDRFQKSPVQLAGKLLDPEGKYTARIQAETVHSQLGPMTLDLQIQTDTSGHQLQAQGSITVLDQKMTLNGYLNDAFMAIASPALISGNYYGITYETFWQDLQGIPLLNLLISENLLSQWDEKVQSVRRQMQREYPVIQLPEITQKDIQKLALAVIAAPCQKEYRSLSLEGETVRCRVLTYEIPAALLRQQMPEQAFLDDLTAVLYLQETSLRLIRILDASGAEYSIQLGKYPGTDPVIFKTPEKMLTWESNEADNTESWTLENPQQTSRYSWDSGEWEISWNAQDPICLRMENTESGLLLESQDFTQLLTALTELPIGQPISGTVVLHSGSQIEKPEYKNMSQWSLEDFFGFLASFGELLGIGFA